MNSEDLIASPKHYSKWVIEPITYVMANGFEFWRGNIIKYASRAGHKLYEGMTQEQSEITDLKKTIRYCELRIEKITEDDT